MEEFEKLVSESFQGEMFEVENSPAATPNTEAAPQENQHDATTETVES
jgi:hypothetical protein